MHLVVDHASDSKTSQIPGLSEVRESVNKLAASAAPPDYVKFQALIKLAANAAYLRGEAALALELDKPRAHRVEAANRAAVMRGGHSDAHKKGRGAPRCRGLSVPRTGRGKR